MLRHGKSSWSSSSLADHDRPLKGRGKRDAQRIGHVLRERGLVPDLIVSSTARRAASTARRAAAAAGFGGRMVHTRELYLSSARDQLSSVAAVAEDGHRCVMMVGHNPTLEDLVERLTGEDVRLTTGNLVAVDLEIDAWTELPRARGTLRFVLRPKELDQAL